VSDLTEKLRFYLSHDDVREALVKKLQQQVTQKDRLTETQHFY
jgi:hypothetical protein